MVLSAGSDESCISTDDTANAATTSSISATTISSQLSVARLESFVKDTKLTSTSEYENLRNSNTCLPCYLDSTSNN